MQAWLQAGRAGAAGEDLNHPANRIAAVDRRARPAQYFDPLDLIDVEKLQAAVTGRGVGDAYAVHQHQALGRLGAANEDAGQAATPAGARDLNAGYPGQQVSDAGRLQAVDVSTGEHRVGGAGLGAVFDLAVGADQRVGQLQGAFAVDGLGQQGGRQ
ncbi:hypothetical protein D3C76_1356550 [compost metagenome]